MPQAGDTPRFDRDPRTMAWDVVPWAPTAAGKSRIAVHRWCAAWRSVDRHGDIHGRLEEANRKIDDLAARLSGPRAALVHVRAPNPTGMLEHLILARTWRVHAALLVSRLPHTVRKGGLCDDTVLTVALPRQATTPLPRHWVLVEPGDTPGVMETAMALLQDGMALAEALHAGRALG